MRYNGVVNKPTIDFYRDQREAEKRANIVPPDRRDTPDNPGSLESQGTARTSYGTPSLIELDMAKNAVRGVNKEIAARKAALEGKPQGS